MTPNRMFLAFLDTLTGTDTGVGTNQAADYDRAHASRYQGGKVPNPLPGSSRPPKLRRMK
jgi:hypothetical protein